MDSLQTLTYDPTADFAPSIIRGEIVDTVDPQPAYRPTVTYGHLLPAWMHSPATALAAIRWAVRHYGHHTLYHLIRGPWYLCLLLWWAPRGAARIIIRLILWAADAKAVEAYRNASNIAAHESPATYLRLRQDRAHRIQARLIALATTLALTALAISITYWYLGTPVVLYAAGALLIVECGIIGRPTTGPTAFARPVDPSDAPRLTSQLITTALGALGIGELNRALKTGDGVRFPSPIVRDGAGWRADIDLPPGVTAGDVADRRDRLASGLRRPTDCVWPETDPHQHAGRLVLWVADKPLSATKPKPWPHADGRPLSLFRPITLGWDPRGREVTATLMYASAVIGAQPRMGKTFTLRLLALATTLDPRAELYIYDLKGGADYLALEPVATRLRVGDDPETIHQLATDLRTLQTDMRARYARLRSLSREECPEGKTTDELASRGIGLHPVVVMIDECQLAYTDPTMGKEITSLAEDLVRRGPAAGITLISATQRPDAKSLPTGISSNAILRYCLRVGDQISNDMVLGTSSYQAGVRATTFSREDRGVGILIGEGDDPIIARTAYIDATAAEQIVAKAAARRTPRPAPVDDDDVETVLDHILAVWPAGETAVWCETLAELLTTHYPAQYAGWGVRQVATAVRPYAPPVQIKRQGSNRNGVRVADLLASRAPQPGRATSTSGRVSETAPD